MAFEWDSAKSDACLDERGFDFGFASHVFRDPQRIERHDKRRKYGEARYQTVGQIEDITYFIVFTRRGEAIRIISAREATGEEDKTYREGGVWQ